MNITLYATFLFLCIQFIILCAENPENINKVIFKKFFKECLMWFNFWITSLKKNIRFHRTLVYLSHFPIIKNKTKKKIHRSKCRSRSSEGVYVTKSMRSMFKDIRICYRVDPPFKTVQLSTPVNFGITNSVYLCFFFFTTEPLNYHNRNTLLQ